MSQLKFTVDEFWTGGYFELALELGDYSDDRLEKALTAIWQHPAVRGCYLQADIEPTEQEQIEPVRKHVEESMRLYGLLTLPSQQEIVCGTLQIREDDDGSDWMIFYCPSGALHSAYKRAGYTSNDPENVGVWLRNADRWIAGLFAEIGMIVYQTIDFKLGLVGREVAGDAYAEEIATSGIPAKRPFGYLWPESGALRYYPENL